MKTKKEEKAISLENLGIYRNDLIKMGFVSEHVDENGNSYFKLTELGKKSGLKEYSN